VGAGFQCDECKEHLHILQENPRRIHDSHNHDAGPCMFLELQLPATYVY